MHHNMLNSELFDSKPLLRRMEKNKIELQLKQKIQHAISQCISSYMLSSFKKQIQEDFQINHAYCNRQATQKQSWTDSNVLKNIPENQKISQIVKNLPYCFESSINQLTSSVLHLFTSNSSNKQIKPTIIYKDKSNTQLCESSKNFLLQLFIQLGLLRNYREPDRTFVRLVEEAHKSYYQIQQIVENHSYRSQAVSFLKHDRSLSQLSQYKPDLMETASTFYSTKKRWEDAQNHYFQINKTLESSPKVVGYTPTESVDNFFDDETKETTNLLQKTKNTDESSLSSGFYFANSPAQRLNIKQQNQNGLLCLHDQLFVKIHQKYGSLQEKTEIQ